MSEVYDLIQRLINKTKDGSRKWWSVPRNRYTALQETDETIKHAYATDFKGKYLVIFAFTTLESPDGETWYKAQYPALAVTETDYDKVYNFPTDEYMANKSELWRLLKLVQRQSNKIDDLLRDFLNED